MLGFFFTSKRLIKILTNRLSLPEIPTLNIYRKYLVYPFLIKLKM